MPDATERYRDDNPTPEMTDDRTDSEAAVGPVSAATARLIRTAERFDADAATESSLCPGWTRRHVLTHVARNADALTNLLTWATTGREALMYPSLEQRNVEIEEGATRPIEQIVADLRSSAERLAAAVSSVPEEAWERQVRTGPGGAGPTVPARRVMWLRLREVEIHHVDLDAGYTPDDWPQPFVDRALRETLQAFGRRDDVPSFTVVVDGTPERVGTGGGVTVHGTAAALLGWVVGRTDGAALRTEPTGALPELPAWA